MEIANIVKSQFYTCPDEEGIFYATSPDCIFYYRCENGALRTRACFLWQRFDIHSLRCRRRVEVDCNPKYAGIWQPLFGEGSQMEGEGTDGGNEGVIGNEGETQGITIEENTAEQDILETENSEMTSRSPGDQEVGVGMENPETEQTATSVEGPVAGEDSSNDNSEPEITPNESTPVEEESLEAQDTAAIKEILAVEQSESRVESSTEEDSSEGGSQVQEESKATEEILGANVKSSEHQLKTPEEESTLGKHNEFKLKIPTVGKSPIDGESPKTAESPEAQMIGTENETSAEEHTAKENLIAMKPSTEDNSAEVNTLETAIKKEILEGKQSETVSDCSQPEEHLLDENSLIGSPEHEEHIAADKNSSKFEESTTKQEKPEAEKFSSDIKIPTPENPPTDTVLKAEVKSKKTAIENPEASLENLMQNESLVNEEDSVLGRRSTPEESVIPKVENSMAQEGPVQEKSPASNPADLGNPEDGNGTEKDVEILEDQNTTPIKLDLITERPKIDEYLKEDTKNISGNDRISEDDDSIIFPESDNSMENLSHMEDDENGNEREFNKSVDTPSLSSTLSNLTLEETSLQPFQGKEDSLGRFWYWCGSGRFVLAQNSEEGDTICLELPDPQAINEESQAGGDWTEHTFLGTSDNF